MSRRNHKGSDLKFCSCVACRYGRHRPRGKWVVLAARRRARRKSKQLIKAGIYDVSPNVSVVYTD